MKTCKLVLGIVNGSKPDEFAPNAPVTREQITSMIVRTLKAAMPMLDTSKAKFTQVFHDETNISGYAVESLKFLNDNEIIKGSNNYILPKSNTTREQGISLIKRTFEKFIKF